MKHIYSAVLLFIFGSQQNILAQACTGAPAANVAIASATNMCAGSSLTLTLQNAYSATGIVYQWATGTSSVGPWNPINSANAASLITNTLTQSAWYTAIIGCTNSFMSTTATAVYLSINAASATTTTPYVENFEAPMPNGLPNCSWAASSLGTNCIGFSPAIPGISPLSGVRMLGFVYSSSALGNHEFYSQGITLQPNIVYSVAVHQLVSYFPNANNWSTFGIGIGLAQSVTNGTVVFTTSNPISFAYAARSATFVVPATSTYYVRLFATSIFGSTIAPYLTFDDLSVTVACNIAPNGASVTLASSVICSAPTVTVNLVPAPNCTVAGGNTFTVNPQSVPPFNTYTVLVTNTITGCVAINNLNLNISPTPSVIAFSTLPEICQTTTTNIYAVGANSFTLFPNNVPFANTVTVSPIATTNYTIMGATLGGCSNTKTITIIVNPLPVISLSQNSIAICKGETFTFSASGSTVYAIGTNNYTSTLISPRVFSDSVLIIKGTDLKGCENTATLIAKVGDCLGMPSFAADPDFIVFPNPNAGTFKIVVAQNASLKIRDVSGRLVYSSELKAGTNTIQQKDLSRGLYVIEVQTDAGVKKKQLIID